MSTQFLGDDVVPGVLVELAERIDAVRAPLLDGFAARVSVLIPGMRLARFGAESHAVFGALLTWFAAPDDLGDRLRALRAPRSLASAEPIVFQRLADALDWTLRDVLADAYDITHSRAFGGSTRLMLALVQRLREAEAANAPAQRGIERSNDAWEHRGDNDPKGKETSARSYARPTVQRLDTQGRSDGANPGSRFIETPDA